MDLADRRLCLLFTPQLCAGDPWQTLGRALDAGLPLVQWRVEREDEDGLDRCLALCSEYAVPVIVNDHVELAVRAGAAGAHVGQDDMPAETTRRLLGEERCLGVSTHDLAQASAAVMAGANYVGLGPCFPTATKGYEKGLEKNVLLEVSRSVEIPIFAIGGITDANLPSLRELGFRHFAVSGAILASEDPGDAVARLLVASQP